MIYILVQRFNDTITFRQLAVRQHTIHPSSFRCHMDCSQARKDIDQSDVDLKSFINCLTRGGCGFWGVGLNWLLRCLLKLRLWEIPMTFLWCWSFIAGLAVVVGRCAGLWPLIVGRRYLVVSSSWSLVSHPRGSKCCRRVRPERLGACLSS